MPAKIIRHGDCRLEPLSDSLRVSLGTTFDRIRAAVHQAVEIGDEPRADRLRADQLAVGELLAQVISIMDRHVRDGMTEQRGEIELAGVRRAHEAIVSV